MNAAAEAMEWDRRLVRPLLSLHVRRGDACNEEQIELKKRRCDDLSVYMKAVATLADKYSFKTVYLATDDAGVVADTAHYPEYTWLVAPSLDRSALKTRKWEANLKSGAMDNYGEAKLLEASDRTWLGKPQPPPARAMWRSLFPAAAKVEVDNVWLCERVGGDAV